MTHPQPRRGALGVSHPLTGAQSLHLGFVMIELTQARLKELLSLAAFVR